MQGDPGRPIIEWGVASRTLVGERECGDSHLVGLLEGMALVSVVDGLGHGEAAAAAAKAAVRALETAKWSRLEEAVAFCHERLVGTRGVAMSVALMDARTGTIAWVGVGNVQAVVVRAAAGRGARSRSARADDTLSTRGGVVGYKLPPLRVSTVPVAVGDLLVMATDGVRAEFARGLTPLEGERPDELARAVLARHARDNDDALVLVARYLGWGA